MTVTLDVPGELLRRAEAAAAERRTTVETLALEGLRRVVAGEPHEATQSEAASTQPHARILTFHGDGLADGVPADFIDNLRDYIYDEELPDLGDGTDAQ